ncbi:MAG: hypothetical protein HW384_82 [Dehalococcoidia bacterium]|nr:hypothetical protein [Dehalococcoidia bacterium]MBF8303986.1 hypothetical protein [Dehalococcoidia bacterium]
MPILVNTLLIFVAVLLFTALVLLWKIYAVVKKQKTDSQKGNKSTVASSK